MTERERGQLEAALITGGLLTLVFLYFLFGARVFDRDTGVKPTAAQETLGWYEISRSRLDIGSFDVSEWRGWSWPPSQRSDNFRVSIEGQFACYPQGGTLLAVMDETNYQRFQRGYPPLVIQTFSCGQPVRVVGQDAGFAIVFVRKKEEPPQQPIPQSLGELLLLLLQSAQRSQTPPARVTAELDWVVEYYGTPAEASSLKRGVPISKRRYPVKTPEEGGMRRIPP